MIIDTHETIELARAEMERRKRARLKSFPTFGEWLPQASPEMTWDWSWQRHVQPEYDKVTSGETSRLMVLLPPRHGKTEMGTVRYPIYRMGRDATTRTIVAAYGQEMANKISRKARKVARQRLTLSKERAAVQDWETSAQGGMRASGIGGAVTGMGAHLIFVDDPVKNRKQANSKAFSEATWAWYSDDLYTRLEPGGAIVLQTTRWHDLDLAGRILKSDDAPNWKVIRLPAIAEEDDPLGRQPGEALCPERWPIDVLLGIKRVLRNAFWALYQGVPRAKEGDIFQRDWFGIENQGPPEDQVVSRVWAWDFAATEGAGDWTVGVLMAKTKDGTFWVENVIRGQWAPHQRDQQVMKAAASAPKGTRFHVEQEPGSAGKTVAQSFVRMLAGWKATFGVSTQKKALRAEPYASQAAIGNIRLVRGKWNHIFIEEHIDFDSGVNDDQVDAATMAFDLNAAKRKVQWT